MAFGRNRVSIQIAAQDATGRAIASAKANLHGLASTARTALGGLGVGLGVAGIARFTRSVVDYGSKLTDSAEATNTNVEALQALRYAATMAGASEKQLDMALVRVQKSAYDARNGLSTAARAFEKLGIEVEAFTRLPAERKLEEIGRAVANATDQQDAYGAALDIIGSRNAPRLMEVLRRLGTDGFEKLAQDAKQSVGIMAAETARALDAMADGLAAFGVKMKNLYGEGFVRLMQGFGADIDLPSVEIEKINTQLLRLYKTLEEGKDTQRVFGSPFGSYVETIKFDRAGVERQIRGLLDERAKIVQRVEEQQRKDDERQGLAGSLLSEPEEAVGAAASKATDRIEELRRRLTMAQQTPAQNIALLRRETEGLQAAMDALRAAGQDASEDFLQKQIQYLEKAYDLQQLQTREAERARREQEALVRSISGSRGMDGGGEAGPRYNLQGFQTMRDVERENRQVAAGIVFNAAHRWLNPANAPANRPASMAPQVAIDLPAISSAAPDESGASTEAAAGRIGSSLDSAAAVFERTAEAIAAFARRLETAEQQIANAR
jgi:hypothetical protein